MATEKFTTELVITTSSADQQYKQRLQETIRLQTRAQQIEATMQQNQQRIDAARALGRSRGEMYERTSADFDRTRLLHQLTRGNPSPLSAAAQSRAERPVGGSYFENAFARETATYTAGSLAARMGMRQLSDIGPAYREAQAAELLRARMQGAQFQNAPGAASPAARRMQAIAARRAAMTMRLSPFDDSPSDYNDYAFTPYTGYLTPYVRATPDFGGPLSYMTEFARRMGGHTGRGLSYTGRMLRAGIQGIGNFFDPSVGLSGPAFMGQGALLRNRAGYAALTSAFNGPADRGLGSFGDYITSGLGRFGTMTATGLASGFGRFGNMFGSGSASLADASGPGGFLSRIAAAPGRFGAMLRRGLLGVGSALSIALAGRPGRDLNSALPDISSVIEREPHPIARSGSRFYRGMDSSYPEDQLSPEETAKYVRRQLGSIGWRADAMNVPWSAHTSGSTHDALSQQNAATSLAADPKVAAAAAQAAANTPQARAAAAGGGDGDGDGDGKVGGGAGGGRRRRRRQLADAERDAEEQRAQQIAARLPFITRAGQLVAGMGNTLFTPGVSSVGGALGGAAIGAAELLQMRGAHTFAAGGSAGGFIGATAVLTGLNAIKSGFDRGNEIRSQAEPLYTRAEPLFMREARQRELLGTTDASDVRALGGVRAGLSFKPVSNAAIDKLRAKRAANVKLRNLFVATNHQDLASITTDRIADIDAEMGSEAFETVGSKVAKSTAQLATERFGMLKRELGDFMGMGDALKTYESFRATSGVARMQSLEAGKALRTGMLAGISPDLLAAASAVGASPGQVGGGFRLGKDQFTDIGTLRYQQESLLRANMVGAPANQILQETLQRQAALAAMGATTNFDRDALMQRTMLDAGVAPQQMTTISNQLTGMRTSALERNMAPRRAVMASMLEAAAYQRGGTYDEAMRILATESEAEQLEKAISTGMFSGDLLNFSAGGLDPRNPKGMGAALRAIGSGATQGKAQAEGLADLTPTEYARTAINQLLTWSGIGAQADLTKQATIVDLQARLDEAAKSMVSSADSLKALTASLGSNFLAAPSYGATD